MGRGRRVVARRVSMGAIGCVICWRRRFHGVARPIARPSGGLGFDSKLDLVADDSGPGVDPEGLSA